MEKPNNSQVISDQINTNEDQLRNICENIPGVVFQFKLDKYGLMSFSFLSKNVQEIFGFSAEDIRNDSELFIRQMHPKDRAQFKKLLEVSAEQLEEYHHELRFISNSGNTIWLEAKASPRKMEDSSIVWNGIAIDITKQREAEEKLLNQEAKTRAIFNAAPVPMLVLDKDTKVVAANNILKKMFNITDDDIINTNPGDGLNCIVSYKNNGGCGSNPECNNCVVRLTVSEVLNTGKPIRNREVNNTFIINDNHVNVWMEMNAELLNLQSEDHVVVSFIDITQKKEAENLLIQSEKKYRTVANYTYDWEYWMDKDHNYTYMSPSVKEHTGFEADDFIQKRITFEKLATDEYKELVSKHMQSDLETLGKMCSLDFRIITKSGEYRWINHICRAVYDDGKFLGRRGSNRDITEIRLAQEALLESEKKFRKELEEKVKLRTQELDSQYNFLRTLIDTIPHPIFIKNSSGQFTTVNKAFVKFYETSFKEIIGNTVEALATKEVAELTNSIDANLMNNPKQFEYESYHFLKNGKKRNIAIYKSAFGLDQNNPEGVAGIVIDITEQKKLAEKYERALQQEMELNEMKTTFISMVSHEFRTPLTSILASADLLELYGRSWPEDKFKKNVSILQESVSEMVDMLNDVLTLSRTDRGKIKFEPHEIDVIGIVSRTVENIKRSTNNSHNFTIGCSKELAGIIADEKIIIDILTRIVSNSAKYSMEGTNISINIDSDDENILLKIKDEGKGIPKDEIKFLFDPFFRTSNVADTKGSGLGLAIVKKMVELHSGSITVESILGEGTTFFIKLKYA